MNIEYEMNSIVEQAINNLIADLPEMVAQAMDESRHDMAKNPTPAIQRLNNEIKYLKAVDALFSGTLQIVKS